MFIQRLKNFFKKQGIHTETPYTENAPLENIHKELVNLRSDIKNSSDKNILNKILANLQNKDYSILSIFIIPFGYWLYNLSLEIMNYGYWSLLDQAALGFEINPVITPLIKLIIAIIFIGIGGLIFINIKQDNNYKKLALILNAVILVLGITSFITLVFTSNNINEKDFYEGVTPIKMLIVNCITITSFILSSIIISYVLYMILKKKIDIDRSQNILILVIALWLSLTSIGTIYIFFSYLKMHQSFSLQSYQCTPDYIDLKNIPDVHIYRIQCDSKCFGYQIINKADKNYEIIPKFFSPEDMEHIKNKKELCKKS